MFERLRAGYYTLFAIALANLLVAFPLGVAGLSTYLSPNGLTRTLLPAFSLFPAIWIGSVAVLLARRRVDRPFRAMKLVLYCNRRWMVRCLTLSFTMILMARAVTSYKANISKVMPFWADPYFADLDQSIFGVDAWLITHKVFGSQATVLIDKVYGLWFMVMMITLGWFCFSRRAEIQVRGLLVSILCWTVLSNFFATIFASVGPCFYERFYGDARFAPMMDRLHAIDAQESLFATRAMSYLLETYGKDVFGTGISAMPSLHVAMALVSFLSIKAYSKQRWLKVLAAIYVAVIFVGSVHLGWHYAVDGIVSIIAVTFFWWATGRYVDWLDARDKARVVSAPALSSLPASA